MEERCIEQKVAVRDPRLYERIARELEAQEEEIARLVERMRKTRILSTLPFPRVDFWCENVTPLFAREGGRLGRLGARAGIPDPLLMARLLWCAHRYDVVFLSGGERADLMYLALAGLCPWIRTPHIVTDAHWQQDEGAWLWLQRLIFRMGARLMVQARPHSREEIALYHRNFGIPPEKLTPVPWSTSLIGYTFHPTRGDFVLTGGGSYRDYNTFFEAMARLDVPVRVGLPGDIPVPAPSANVTVHTTWSNREYMDQMAACRVLALPITPGLERSTADRTILNAMHMRKVVVATDSVGARIYIRHGENGFLVPEGDADAWAEAIRRVYALDDGAYEALADQAEYDARVVFNERMRICRTVTAGLDAISA